MPRDRDAGISRAADFTTTRWSVVLMAGRRSSRESRQALESLCATYWSPLYAYVRRRIRDPGEAQDLTQSFFAELLEKNYVDSATPDRGRFRAFLLTAFKHFLSNQWARARAQKRGGGRAPIPLDFQSADARLRIEPCAGLTAEQLYDRQWAVTLLDQIMKRLESELAREGKAELFAELKGFIIGERSELTYPAVAARLESTEGAVKMAAHRMRRRYRELLREEIAQTVGGPGEVGDEIRKLFHALQM
jgi:RNA polymerase sigma-70 factor (ECF subfamily)